MSAVCSPILLDSYSNFEIDCDNSLQNGGTIAPDGNLQCNMKCDGNSAETCGGPNRLDLYSYGYGNGTA